MSELPSPAAAFRAYDAAEKAAAKANKVAKEAKDEKTKAKAIAQASLEAAELESASTTLEVDGQPRRVLFYTGEFTHYNVSNKAEFKAWAAEEDEEYFEPEPRIREDLVRQECERREQDGEPLPPGVTTYKETRIYRQAM